MVSEADMNGVMPDIREFRNLIAQKNRRKRRMRLPRVEEIAFELGSAIIQEGISPEVNDAEHLVAAAMAVNQVWRENGSHKALQSKYDLLAALSTKPRVKVRKENGLITFSVDDFRASMPIGEADKRNINWREALGYSRKAA